MIEAAVSTAIIGSFGFLGIDRLCRQPDQCAVSIGLIVGIISGFLSAAFLEIRKAVRYPQGRALVSAAVVGFGPIGAIVAALVIPTELVTAIFFGNALTFVACLGVSSIARKA